MTPDDAFVQMKRALQGRRASPGLFGQGEWKERATARPRPQRQDRQGRRDPVRAGLVLVAKRQGDQ
jgi:hypothetical protein